MSKKSDKTLDSILAGAFTLQAVPLLKKSGRTPAALTGTAEGFINLGIAGEIAKSSMRMVKSPMAFTKKTKTKKEVK